MLPTPAPTSPPSSPRPEVTAAAEDHPIVYPPPPPTRGSAPFQVLAALFDKLQGERRPEKRRRLLDSWFNKDRERAVYGLKEKNLAKIYIKLIPLNPRDPDAIRMLNWKRPTERNQSSGDFPSVLYEVISKRSSVVEGTLTIHELNDHLDEISKNMGHSTTSEEQRWIARIILKDMQISVKETTVFAVFHPDAHALFNTCSDIKKIAWELWDPKRKLNDEVHLSPLRRIEDTVKEMQGSNFIIEEKLDGERVQLHKRGNEYFYCSSSWATNRKGKDYTYLYGKHVGEGSLTPWIHKAFDARVDEIILDGEMLVWDPVSERNLPFGTLKTAALDRSKKERAPRPCFKIFDLLYLNGTPLLNKSLKFRKRNLRACLKEVPGRMEFAVEYEGRTADDVRTRMEDIMASRGEGLVIKHPNSQYVLSGRNSDWIKASCWTRGFNVKPEYMDSMGETVDVIVVAGNYGTGRRSGGVSTLVCAVVDDRRPADEVEPKYSTFVRIGTGLSYADYIWVRQKPWKTWDPKNPPSFIQVAKKGSEDKGDVYLEPQDSFLLKIKAAEITNSDLYHMGVTMRFPRAIQIREDLDTSDCTTATAVFESLRSDRKRKMSDTDELSDCVNPKKKQRRTTKKPVILLPQYQSLKLEDVEVESDLFEGMTFMVSSDPKSRTGEQDKKELLRMIRANGGKYVQMAKNNPDVLVVYGGTITPYDIKLIMNRDVCDIIKPQWIRESVTKSERMPLTKRYFFHATSRRMEEDEYVQDDGSLEELALTDQHEEPLETNDKGDATQEDPSIADWFKVEKSSNRSEIQHDDTDSETEPDSDNDDVNRDEDIADEDDISDWVNVDNEDSLKTEEDPVQDASESEPQVRMGETEEAREYDQELIFRHLCFYLDSPANAKKNSMSVKSKNQDELNKGFEKLTTLITEHGGRVVDLDEPKLTHVVVDKRDLSLSSSRLAWTKKHCLMKMASAWQLALFLVLTPAPTEFAP
ncbi:predicted protein [Postia placenta Mad-698-R]|uniref:DNA ligase n=1 Tax=Postia placenta MAD-698-R-SB12 TaxID=670580 RepID=A0A1X6N725_9APHY|nr:hypothetical protein POSPLADRAFT_1136828 [Postia placenta MAD-698-R-SB12]EED85575.1 predicted protein [Postia placenta Mad-698-R]OSX64310.1 hypothetical protein POSPLADRAFT_1136828 [Postia placenta MAD-698-R-SB12]